MSSLFGKLVSKLAEAALDELSKPQGQRESEAGRREEKKARKARRADEAFTRVLDELQARSAPVAREDVTVVLRRQVPPRDEAPRSWIGGLPMLPDTFEWPRARNSEYPDTGEIPLNFAAQIACADLPADLWGGLGPREGWLLFFVATWGCASCQDEGSIRVLHTRELGQERQPPTDKRSVGDPTYSGGDDPSLKHWPVDIISFSNRPAYPSAAPWTGDESVSPIPPQFESALYEGAPVAAKPWRPCEDPFTWGGLALMLERTRSKRARRSAGVREVPRLPAVGRERALDAIAEEEKRLAELLTQTIDPDRQERRDRHIAETRVSLARQREFLLGAGDPFDPEKLAMLVEQSQAERRSWLEQQDEAMGSLLTEA
ncbi:DUF1963 domain-containing protein [Sphingomonas glaciei]|uniref:YwqG family protein n=1 Tax=Sphingomonas glaciei TaxID=2938948 RepID=A0ABY5MV57_9SPHN|nr:DUF1963 domain-containing protein [Sphingomonas glaciei]UUR08123.1 YwqG family protein [Sphingomonas glaciei]